jgi:hypothetical protein
MSYRLSLVSLTVAGAICGGAVSAICAGGSSSLPREGEGEYSITRLMEEDYGAREGQHGPRIEGLGPLEKELYDLHDHSPSPR